MLYIFTDMDEMDPTIDIKIKEFRKSRKLSQEELADSLGISRQSVISLEQGKSLPSLPLAVSLCRFFDTAFEEIFAMGNEIEESINKTYNNNLKLIPENSGGKENHMVELEPWRPFRETVTLRDAIDRLFEDSFIAPSKTGATMPKIDIKDEKDAVVVRAELPGIAEENVDIEIQDNVMTISGKKAEEKEEEKEGYYYKESHSGAFSRSFTLPAEVVADEASADMEKGVLTIRVPKIEPKKAAKVKVSTKK